MIVFISLVFLICVIFCLLLVRQFFFFLVYFLCMIAKEWWWNLRPSSSKLFTNGQLPMIIFICKGYNIGVLFCKGYNIGVF